jgi:hypothetical protein
MSFKTQRTFELEIEQIIKNYEMSHMQAVLHYCETNDIDPSSINRLISKTLKEKIESEATDLNFFPKRGKLPDL